MSNRTEMDPQPSRGLTLLEMLIVSLIIAILTTIAVTTVTGLTQRARIAATRGTIRTMEIAANRYEIDLGEYPISSTGTLFATAVNQNDPGTGCGYFFLSVMHSLSGNAADPLDLRWSGPLMDIEENQIGDIEDINNTWGQVDNVYFGFIGSETAATQQLLDAWGQPFRYVRSGPGTGSIEGYIDFGGTMFPSGSPFATLETYYNYGRFQIVSLGPDGTTFTIPDVGLGDDDITNLGSGR